MTLDNASAPTPDPSPQPDATGPSDAKRQGDSTNMAHQADTAHVPNATPEPGTSPIESLQLTLPEESGPRERYLWMGFLLLLTLIIYGPSLQGGFIWDDDKHVFNRSLRDVAGLKRIWTFPWTEVPAAPGSIAPNYVPQYYPMTHTLFWIQYHLWGLSPLGYHLVNALLHGGSAILLWQILRRLRVPGAWLAAAVFAVHPVNVQSVAWVSELKNTLSLFLALISAWFYLRCADAMEGRSSDGSGDGESAHPNPNEKVGILYATSLGIFFLALLSKTVVASLPVVLILIFWWQGRRLLRHILALAPFLLMGAALGWLTNHVEQTFVHAQGPEWQLSFGERLLIAGHAVWFYIGKVLLPIGQSFVYEKWDVSNAGVLQWGYVLAVPLLLILLAGLGLVRKRWRAPFVTFAIFLVTIFPALGFADIYPMRYYSVADHFQYISMISIVTLGVAALATAARRFKIRKNETLVGASAVLLLLLGGAAWVRAGVFASSLRLWTDTVAKNDTSIMARFNLADAVWRSAAQLSTDGNIPESELRVERALTLYDEVLAMNPNSVEGLIGKGNILIARRRYAEAEVLFRQAVQLSPRQWRANEGLAQALIRQRRAEEAMVYIDKALEIDAGSVNARLLAGDIASDAGKPDVALEHYRIAITSRPDRADDPAINLARLKSARIFMQRDRFADAYLLLYNYLQIDQDSPEAWWRMARVKAVAGDRESLEAAQACLKTALKLRPNYAPAVDTMKLVDEDLANLSSSTKPASTTGPMPNPTTWPAADEPRPTGVSPPTPSPASVPSPVMGSTPATLPGAP